MSLYVDRTKMERKKHTDRSILVEFGLVKFGLVWLFHRQTNKLNNYLILINLICEFVCWQDKKTRKKKTRKPTNGSVYRVAAQLKNTSLTTAIQWILISLAVKYWFDHCTLYLSISLSASPVWLLPRSSLQEG